MKSALDTKLYVKPIFSNVVHTAIWEGPCRVGTVEELSPEYEKRVGKEQCRIWGKQLKENLSTQYVEILEPAYIEYPESFYVSDESFKVLEEDLLRTDIFLISYRLPGLERFGKPVSMINNGPAPVDLGAFYSAIGGEFYFGHDYEEYAKILSHLHVRKAMANTKILVLTAGEQFPVSVNSSNPDIYGLRKKYGIQSSRVSIKDIFPVMHKLECTEEIERKADELIANSKGSICKQYVMNDLTYYEAARKMMDDLGCNAFTTACKELCASRLPMEHKCTPCLAHSLFKDSGIPAGCEEDINVLMAVITLMYLTKQSVFMGNPSLVHKNRRPIEDLGMDELLDGPAEGFDHDVLEIRHAVPSLKLNGFDTPDMEYRIGHFTLEGWGSKVQVNMAKGKTRTVTIARFSRDGNRMMATRGTIIGTALRDIECSPAVYYDVEGGAREFRHALAEGQHGHHLAVVYGDWIQELKELSKIVGFTLEHHH